ncbi:MULTISPECIES: ArsR/SmtB family transcription factor [Glycomyces]|uniref:DNA-binding transcriptional ArsR family regulator n=2 Tax=Glycomyces TaxID=58113 RepID=A0A9X3PGX7_9ACTN|nr:helix-turn-helix domain-containing protein [Glycomyces lechevalierae]MDA1383486.1 helix-turn-helix domain-containing protein [Glycomyces lechevalierae]MDR7336492.1 DNA-binding transcriptional ArsR family regulator [Glycomyces lechevalierae]
MDAPETEELTLTTPQQYRALGHPVRHRLLFALGRESATLSGLATELGISKGSAGHHLKVLREAGLVQLDGTRRVRGGTEQRFKRTAARLRFDSGETTRALLAAVADGMLTDDDPLMLLRGVRLSGAQAQRLRATLESLVHELPDEEGEARYGVLVGLYRPVAPQQVSDRD